MVSRIEPMKNKTKQSIVPILKKVLRKEKRVLFGYLFGSQASRNAISKSDVDVAVYLDENHSKDFFDERLRLIARLSRGLKKDADVVVLNTASPFLRYVVLKEGEVVFEKDKGRRIDYELKSMNEYFDFKPVRQMYHKKLLGRR